jgi:uncharacterized protein (TIGR02217 family)
MTVLPIRLPVGVERGAEGGGRFSTTIFAAASGAEQRNRNWSRIRGRWTVGTAIRDLATLAEFRNLFYVAQGRALGFLFKDWADFRIGGAAPQQIGVGTGAATAFPIVKRYTAGAYSYERPITRPVAGTWRVYVDGVELVEGAGAGKFQINATTGIVTLGTAPAADKPVTITTDFDLPVRFDTDELGLKIEWIKALETGDPDGLGEWSGIPLVELPPGS